MADAWKKFVSCVLEKPNTFVILNGDLINNATRSSVSNIFEETMRPRDQKIKMTEMLTPIRERILCAVPGNHERRSVKDADDEPTYDIMCKLNLENLYRPDMAFMRIMLGESTPRCDGLSRVSAVYNFGVTHGAGGGIYTGASVNRNERFGNVIEGLDCLVVGHTHKGTISKPTKLVFSPKGYAVIRKHYTVISSVSWLEFGGYAMQKMLLPSHTGNPQIIELSSKSKDLKVHW